MGLEEISRWMALDVGERTIGVAVSDPLKIMARPLLSLRRGSLQEDCSRLAELVHSHSVVRIIVGLPRHMGGKQSILEPAFQDFAESLREETGVQLDWQDERLSTRRAEELMAISGIPVSKRRSKRDAFAAAVILEWYIEEHHKC